MAAIGFYLFYGINWIVTLLPLRVLYLFSDFLFPLVYHLVRYRRKVVATNLKNAFPEKSEKERKAIEKKFYHHFCDLIVETLKLTHMSKEQLLRRISYSDPELLDRLYGEGRDVVGILGHYCNWEWLICLPLFTKFKVVTIYKPLTNKHFNKYINEIRSRHGVILTPMSNIVREVIDKRMNNIRTLYTFGTDQTPSKDSIKFWTRFLNQETPVFLGAEKIASKYDMAVVYFNVQKLKRGYYSLSMEPLFDHAAGLHDHSITETHVKRFEESILEKPEFWLWSHRRWKHKREHTDG